MNTDPSFKRTAKDNVFTHLFQDREYVLKLYYALHPETKEQFTEDMIHIVTLENVMVNAIYNDLGFTVGDQLVVLAEAQSTWSVNILIRALLYLAQTYHDYIGEKELNLYGSKKLAIPRPEVYVIYTGKKKLEKDVYSLSEEFFSNPQGKESDLDLKIHVLTEGQEGDIVYQYITFTKVFDEQTRLYGKTLKAVTETIRICIDRNILRDYLSKHEQEVKDIMISLYDEDQIKAAYDKDKIEQGRAEGRREGRAEGRREGRAEGEMTRARDTAFNLRDDGMPVEKIAKMVKVSIPTVQKWLSEPNSAPAN